MYSTSYFFIIQIKIVMVNMLSIKYLLHLKYHPFISEESHSHVIHTIRAYKVIFKCIGITKVQKVVLNAEYCQNLKGII